MEFNIPRLGSRIDAALISGPVIFAIEFKVGEADFKRGDLNQVWDYVRIPRDFDHRFHGKTITDSSAIRSPIPRQSDQ